MSDSTDLRAMAHVCDYLRHENTELRRILADAIAVAAMRTPSAAHVLRAELRDIDARRMDPMVRA